MDVIGKYDDVVKYIKSLPNIESFYPLNGNKWLAIQHNPNLIHIECEIAWEGSTAAELLQIVEGDPNTIIDNDIMIPSIHVLYALKMSHRYLRNSKHFIKTHKDIKTLRMLGANIFKAYDGWFKRREEETYDYGHPKLNVSKQDFFADDGIGYVYDHDDIHKVVALGYNPAYLRFKIPEEDVLCSKRLFFECDLQIRLNAVYEEATVLALERSQIPFDDIDPYRSFNIALTKICTSITSGWFREFAWEHFEKVQQMYDSSYVDKFWNAVKNREVKRV